MEYAIHISRGKRETGKPPQYKMFRYASDNPYITLVQALEYIQSKCDRSLLFRRSCFHGSCGTCGVVVNGKKVLACLTRLADFAEKELFVEPLTAFPVIGDLAVNPARLYSQLPQQRQYIRRVESRAEKPTTGSSDDVSNNKNAAPQASDNAPAAAADAPAEQLEQCIECGLCESACPVTAPFLGPAALAAYYRELANRPERREQLLARVAEPDGIAPCKSAYLCSKVCPAGVYPSGKIIKLRKELER